MKKLLILLIILFFSHNLSSNLFSQSPLAAYKDGLKFKFIDDNGKLMFSKDSILSIVSFTDEMFVLKVVRNKKAHWAIMNLKGEVKIINEADDIKSYKEGFAVVIKETPNEFIDKKYAMIDKEGKYFKDFIYFDMISFSEGLAFVWNNKERGYINTKGKMVLPLAGKTVGYTFSNGIAAVSNENFQVGFINKMGDKVLDYIFDEPGLYKDGLIKTVFKGQVGYTDLLGNRTHNFKYYGGTDYENGSAFIAKQGPQMTYRWALADKKGNILTKHIYHTVHPMSQGLSAVSTGKTWGFINNKGQVVIQDNYRFADSFKGKKGLAWVSKLNKDKSEATGGFINKQGKFVIKVPKLDFVFDLRTNRRVY